MYLCVFKQQTCLVNGLFFVITPLAVQMDDVDMYPPSGPAPVGPEDLQEPEAQYLTPPRKHDMIEWLKQEWFDLLLCMLFVIACMGCVGFVHYLGFFRVLFSVLTALMVVGKMSPYLPYLK